MLKIQKLTKHFGGVKAVNDCSFEIEKGKITALIGPNGSGKSTIFNCVSGITKPDTGEIFFNKQNITKLSVDSISNKGISRVFQKSQLFKNLTVRENLLLAIDNEDQKFWKNVFGLNKFTSNKEDRVGDLLERMELLPIMNKPANDLSFGQKRLVELVRTILNPHELLMLDEPVAGVNPKIRNFIAEMLTELRDRGTTILLIEHDMAFTLSLSNSIIVLDAGKIIAQDTPQKIRGNRAVLEAYLGKKYD